jgi:hypothetical protein
MRLLRGRPEDYPEDHPAITTISPKVINQQDEKGRRLTFYLPSRKFAERAGLSFWLARALVLRGEIPSVQCGRRRRVSA